MITPSRFVATWVPRLAAMLPEGASALDLASGMGRHTMVLADSGFRTFAVDRSVDDLIAATRQAGARGLQVLAWASDLETRVLPAHRFDLVLCTRYLQRTLWPSIHEAIRSGGFILYETYTTEQLRHPTGPRSPDHLLALGELRRAFTGWNVIAYEEVGEPEAVASLVARKP